MDNPELQDLFQHLDYGHIYVYGNPKQTHNLRWFATMIEPMIRPLSLKWIETWDIDHTVIVARRFNVGNLGRYAVVQLHLNKYGRSDSYSLLAAVHAFSDCLSDVMDDSRGDVIINEDDFGDRNEPPRGKWGSSTASTPFNEILQERKSLSCPQDHTRVEPSRRHVERFEFKVKKEKQSRRKQISDEDVPKSLPRWIQDDEIDASVGVAGDSEEIISQGRYYDEDTCAEASVVQDLEVEEVLESRRIESEYERDVNDLRMRIVAFIAKYHQDPQQMMSTLLEGKVLIGQNPGHLLVNGDMKIVLPDYDEMEIKMSAMCRTLYILFMKKRVLGQGGFELRDIDKYRDELVDIYCLVKPGANEERVRSTVDNLCDPWSNSLNETISRANGFIKKCIVDKQLCQQYLISGTRGGEYSIALDPGLMQLPRAVTEA